VDISGYKLTFNITLTFALLDVFLVRGTSWVRNGYHVCALTVALSKKSNCRPTYLIVYLYLGQGDFFETQCRFSLFSMRTQDRLRQTDNA